MSNTRLNCTTKKYQLLHVCIAGALALALMGTNVEEAKAQDPQRALHNAIVAATDAIPRPFPYDDQYWGGRSHMGPPHGPGCDANQNYAGLAYADEMYKIAVKRGLITKAEAKIWVDARNVAIHKLKVQLNFAEDFSSCSSRRSYVKVLNSLLPTITLSDETFAVCNREVETLYALLLQNTAMARASQFKDEKGWQINSLEGAGNTVYNDYKATRPQGMSSIKACDNAKDILYKRTVDMVACRFGTCFGAPVPGFGF